MWRSDGALIAYTIISIFAASFLFAFLFETIVGSVERRGAAEREYIARQYVESLGIDYDEQKGDQQC